MKKILFSIIFAYFVVVFMFHMIPALGTIEADSSASLIWERTNLPNTVTAVYLLTRVYDTVFEVLLFSLIVVAVGFLLKYEPKSEISEQTVFLTARVFSGGIMAISIVIFLNVVLRGHITPGGGFAGGVILASGVVLYGICSNFIRALAHYDFFNIKFFETISFVTVISIMTMVSVFPNIVLFFTSPGEPKTILSGGIIPLMNLLIGFKVYAGSWKLASEFVVRRGTL
ncbi:MAG: MnhB domain-containing protein [Kosmotogaceae bacterium]